MATQSEIAIHLDLSTRSVADLASKGILPPAIGKGNLDLEACRVAYIRHLRGRAAGRQNGAPGLDLMTERARLAAEQANHYEMKNQMAKGELLDAGQVRLAVCSAFTRVRDKLLSLPGRLAAPLARLTAPGEVKAALAESITKALEELSEVRVLEEGCRHDD